MPSLLSSTAIRAFSASFSSRARRAISLTASNSSRLTISRSRRIFSAWLRQSASTSRLTPWAAPAASFISRPISSKNRLVVCVMATSPARELKQENGDPGGFVQGPRKAGTAARLVMLPFPCNRIEGARNQKTQRRLNETPMIDRQVDIETRDGKTTTFITRPERGGPFPVIIFYMDAPAIREELRDMARRLGTSGYYVMLPNMYYRAGVMEIGPINPDPESPERKRMFQLMSSIDIPMIMEDTKALLAYADAQAAANTRIVGTVGYCMSGRYAVNAATHFADRVKAAASVYGVQLATDQPDSPQDRKSTR